jgi:hypothetical protein
MVGKPFEPAVTPRGIARAAPFAPLVPTPPARGTASGIDVIARLVVGKPDKAPAMSPPPRAGVDTSTRTPDLALTAPRGTVGDPIDVEAMSRRGIAAPLGTGPPRCCVNCARALSGIASGRSAFSVTHTL